MDRLVCVYVCVSRYNHYQIRVAQGEVKQSRREAAGARDTLDLPAGGGPGRHFRDGVRRYSPFGVPRHRINRQAVERPVFFEPFRSE